MKPFALLAGWSGVAAGFAVELAKATLATIRAVLGATLGGNGALRPAILAVPLDLRSPAGIALFADMVTLTPGTTSLDVSEDRSVLYVHVLDAPDHAAAVAEMKAALEARVRRVLP
ncbi:MAG: Na+/H+ antiporter subunit E [Alphaproteobacteria bacterium]|nr:Na+/H+ antiporter subunit E [Alphaproteobacteria bacterium]